jgi:hypothetical protein
LNTGAEASGRVLDFRHGIFDTAETVLGGFVGASALGFETGVFVEVVKTCLHALWHVAHGIIPGTGNGDGGETQESEGEESHDGVSGRNLYRPGYQGGSSGGCDYWDLKNERTVQES